MALVSTLCVYNTRLLVPFPSFSSPMGTDSSLPIVAPSGAPSSSQIHTTLSMDGFPVVNNMKIANPPYCSVHPAVMDCTPPPPTQSLQTNVTMLIEDKSTSLTHAYSRVEGIKPGTYSRSLFRSDPRPKGRNLSCAGCNAVHSLEIEHCHKHDCDKNGKGPLKRLRR